MPTLLLFFDHNIWIFSQQKLWILYQQHHRKFRVKPTLEQGKQFMASACHKMAESHSVVWSDGEFLLRPEGVFVCQMVREEQGLEILDCVLCSEDPALWFSLLLKFNREQVVLDPLGGRPAAPRESYFE